jgi:nitrogen fixation protein NifQ
MTPREVYELLRNASAAVVCDPFDAHVMACIYAVAANECSSGGSFTDALGISGAPLRQNIERYFPGTLEQLEAFELDKAPNVSEDERCLRELLWRFRTAPSPLNSLLSALISRRATRPNHLWQDLGLGNRGELSMLMQKHFTLLARRNTQDMKWKKFFYRMICRDENYRICTAPSCSECCDFKACFGDESGESLLARIKHSIETPTGLLIQGSHAI